MAKSKSTISLALLPVEDIASYLEIVQGFSKKSEKAVDVDAVAGVPAETIAIAVDADHRTTVENALNLGGVPAASYLTTEGSEALLNDTYKVSTTLSNELKEVRDELYQLKSELAKQGYIKQNHVYDGFYDAFRYDEIRYMDKEIATVAGEHTPADNLVSLSSVDFISPGEFIGLVDSSGSMHAYYVEDINGSNQVQLDRTLGEVVLSGSSVYKYAGSYNNGEFVFGKRTGSYTSSQTEKVIIKDGRERVSIKTLDDECRGFATKLSNYYSTYDTFIRKVNFSLAYSGNPGSIKASIWEVKDDSNANAPVCELIGESDSVYASSCSMALTEVEFIFQEPVEVKAGRNYLIALYCGGVSSSNTWKIGGYVDDYDEATGKQWFVDDTYTYNGDNVFEMIPGSTDAYLALNISRQIEAEVVYSESGLYSCEEEIQGGFTRARVELRINREGSYNVSSSAQLSTNANNQLQLMGEEVNACPFVAEDTVVVGNMFSTLSSNCTNKAIFMADNMYTPVGADVYRMGYRVVAKCKSKIQDVPLQYGDETIIELPLVAIMPGKEPGKEVYSSDRLIFESEILSGEGKALEVFDHIEVQVFWKSSLQSSTINTDEQFAGKILDLSVSTDKSYNKA